MEGYVKSLFDRLDQEKKQQLYVIMQSALNEVYNSGLIKQAELNGNTKLHDPDPDVRVTEKTLLAKSAGKSHIQATNSLAAKDKNGNGILIYETRVTYDPQFSSSIALCIQGGIEGLYQSGIYKQVHLKYQIIVTNEDADICEFSDKISQINEFYEPIDVEVCKLSQLSSFYEQNGIEITQRDSDNINQTESAPGTSSSASKPQSENKAVQNDASQNNESNQFWNKMKQNSAFGKSCTQAKTELENAIRNQTAFIKEWKNKLSLDEWNALDDFGKFIKVLKLGFFGIVFSQCICVDFSEDIPNCIAIALLFLADTGKMRRQVIDAGDNTDTKYLVDALNALDGCCGNWDCTIVHPNYFKLGGKASTQPSSSHSQGRVQTEPNKNKNQKKSFWKRLFG